MTNLSLPPDVAMQKKIQAMQQNQLYTLAFQIYQHLLSVSTTEPEARVAAAWSIRFAEIFEEQVKADSRSKK